MNNANLIANRYEVYQHIGQGGMADVFLAVDTILNRQVAVKILRAELCTDEISVLRFEREAQAATALSHPNIVEIYDVGEFKGHHYIVMEYVAGKTLKKVIQQRGSLTKEEAIDIMKQLTSAVAEAHRRGVIHRDLKPQNIILKSDGSVKILDFGIALAKGAMQLTQANNVMGSVHYLAPELAKGQPATPQSDIYALGIIMFEILTGDVPFKADQAVQIALMQIHNEMPYVRSINPLVPQSVENIVIRASAKDPSMRYRSCNDMYEDLRTCLRPERQVEPKIQLKNRGAQIQDLDEDNDDYDEDSEDYYEEETPVSRLEKNSERAARRNQSNERVSSAAISRKSSNKKNRMLLAVLVFLLLLLSISGVYFALNLSGTLKGKVTTVEVPSIIGMTLTEAKDACTENDLLLDTSSIVYTLTDNVEKGHIITVDPAVGTEVEKGAKLSVIVSSGIGVYMKDYSGMLLGDALEDLQQYSYLQVTTREEKDEYITPGYVIRQELLEPGMQFNPETTDQIVIVYSAYPSITIPADIVGKPIEEAIAQLENMGAEVVTSNLDTTGLTDEEIANLQTGIVIKSDPDINQEYTQKNDNYVVLYYY